MLVLISLGIVFLAAVFLCIRARECPHPEALQSLSLFRVRMSNLGLVTQNIQWLVLMGIACVVSVFLQVVRGYSAIHAGAVFTAATLGILLSLMAAERLATRFAQRTLIRAGSVVTLPGIVLVVVLVRASFCALAFVPGPVVIGVGVLLAPSVNVVQSSFPDEEQVEISGLPRAVSNVGSSLGIAIAGTILVSGPASRSRSYAYSMLALAAIGLVGLVAAAFMPANPPDNPPGSAEGAR